MKFVVTALTILAVAPAVIFGQGIVGTGSKPCGGCDMSAESGPGSSVVCTALENEDDVCITTTIKCPFKPEVEEYCCCCRPNRPNGPAIVCNAKPKGEGCICSFVRCDIPWEPEWAQDWIPSL